MFKKVPLFKTLEEAEQRAEAYFKRFPHIDEADTPEEIAQAKDNLINGILPTISGLSLAIGLNDWRDFNRYLQKPKFKRLFAGFKSRLLRYWETALATGKGAQGVSTWINAFTQGEMLSSTAQSSENKGVCAVVVIGSDGNRQALSDIINATQAQRIQGIKTIDTQAEVIAKKTAPARLPARSQSKRNTKPRKAQPKQ